MWHPQESFVIQHVQCCSGSTCNPLPFGHYFFNFLDCVWSSVHVLDNAFLIPYQYLK